MARVIIHDQQEGPGSQTKKQHTWSNSRMSIGQTFFCFTHNAQEEMDYLLWEIKFQKVGVIRLFRH